MDNPSYWHFWEAIPIWPMHESQSCACSTNAAVQAADEFGRLVWHRHLSGYRLFRSSRYSPGVINSPSSKWLLSTPGRTLIKGSAHLTGGDYIVTGGRADNEPMRGGIYRCRRKQLQALCSRQRRPKPRSAAQNAGPTVSHASNYILPRGLYLIKGQSASNALHDVLPDVSVAQNVLYEALCASKVAIA
jgi:hypothetical protein